MQAKKVCARLENFVYLHGWRRTLGRSRLSFWPPTVRICGRKEGRKEGSGAPIKFGQKTSFKFATATSDISLLLYLSCSYFTPRPTDRPTDLVILDFTRRRRGIKFCQSGKAGRLKARAKLCPTSIRPSVERRSPALHFCDRHGDRGVTETLRSDRPHS